MAVQNENELETGTEVVGRMLTRAVSDKGLEEIYNLRQDNGEALVLYDYVEDRFTTTGSPGVTIEFGFIRSRQKLHTGAFKKYIQSVIARDREAIIRENSGVEDRAGAWARLGDGRIHPSAVSDEGLSRLIDHYIDRGYIQEISRLTDSPYFESLIRSLDASHLSNNQLLKVLLFSDTRKYRNNAIQVLFHNNKLTKDFFNLLDRAMSRGFEYMTSDKLGEVLRNASLLLKDLIERTNLSESERDQLAASAEDCFNKISEGYVFATASRPPLLTYRGSSAIADMLDLTHAHKGIKANILVDLAHAGAIIHDEDKGRGDILLSCLAPNATLGRSFVRNSLTGEHGSRLISVLNSGGYRKIFVSRFINELFCHELEFTALYDLPADCLVRIRDRIEFVEVDFDLTKPDAADAMKRAFDFIFVPRCNK